MQQIRIGYWSAGITSAVACKMSLEMYDNVRLVYIDTGKVHPDNERFKKDCEQWYGVKIETVRNTSGYTSPIDVINKTGYVNGPDGARCTLELKKKVRFQLEEKYKADLFNSEILVNQIFGYEYDTKQVNRAIRFLQQYPHANALFPLIEKGLTKDNCAGILINAGIAIPEMYNLGYPNNNCIGCVKGGKGYWNKIRADFPDVFEEMKAAERKAGHSCIKNTFLDELGPNEGKKSKIIMPNCGTFCEVEFGDMPVKNLMQVMNKEISVYEAAKLAA